MLSGGPAPTSSTPPLSGSSLQVLSGCILRMLAKSSSTEPSCTSLGPLYHSPNHRAIVTEVPSTVLACGTCTLDLWLACGSQGGCQGHLFQLSL